MRDEGGVCMTKGGMHGKGGACVAGGMYGRGRVWQGGDLCVEETATEAGGAHPTEMHSCLDLILLHFSHPSSSIIFIF